MSKFDHLLGRPYKLGTNDCFSIIRQYYHEEWGILVPNYARPTDFWLDPDLDLYRQYFAPNGFEIVTEGPPAVGDVFLMPLLSQMNSHAAVLIDTNLILHHLPNQIGSIDRLKPKWWGRVMVTLRHPEVTEAQKKSQSKEAQHVHRLIDHHLFRDPEFQKTAAQVEAERFE